MGVALVLLNAASQCTQWPLRWRGGLLSSLFLSAGSCNTIASTSASVAGLACQYWLTATSTVATCARQLSYSSSLSFSNSASALSTPSSTASAITGPSSS